MKTCSKCIIQKEDSEFSSRRWPGGIGLSSWCKECKSALERSRRLQFGDSIRARDKERWISGKRERAKPLRRVFYLRNRQAILNDAKNRYLARKSAGIKRKKWIPKSRGALIRNMLRSRIRASNFLNRNGHWTELIGAHPNFIRAHLESNFLKGMSWDNHGLSGWHIDHHIPLCKFDLTDAFQVKCAFNWRNLVPINSQDNLRKAGSLPHDHVDFLQWLRACVKADGINCIRKRLLG